jgi:hypothetical protein
MNAMKSGAIAVILGLLAFAAGPAQSADGPLAHFAGKWSGSGKITVKGGDSERIRCRASNSATGNTLSLSMRCASDSYKFELGSEISSDGGAISGTWNETSRGVYGNLAGRMTGNNIQANASAVGVNASLSIRTTGNSLSLAIRSPGSEVSEVSVSMAKGGR